MSYWRLAAAVFVATAGLAGSGAALAQVAGSAVALPLRFASAKLSAGEQMVLQCPGSGWTQAPCQMLVQYPSRPEPDRTAMQFGVLTAQQRYLKRLIADAADAALAGLLKGQGEPLSAADRDLLQQARQSVDACMADPRFADLVVACPAAEQGREAIVLFLRGLCNVCDFAPAVLRRVP